MAALYLHNSMFAPDASKSSIPASADIYTPQHGRHRSSQSTATMTPSSRTSGSEFSYPTEPLLQSDFFGAIAYADILSRQPTHPNGPQPGWDMGLTLVGDQPTMDERKNFWEQTVRRRLKRLRVTKGALELLIGVWAAYNSIRYFLALTFYESFEAQAVSLALGASTTMSIALLMTSALIASFSSYLISVRISDRFLHTVRVALRYLASFFLLTPAIVTFALVLAWRNASDPELRFYERCHWDIDVVWSGPGSRCEPHAPSWGAWLAGSTVRMIFTLFVIVAYHVTSRAYSHTRRPSQLRNSRSKRRTVHTPSQSVSDPSALSPIFKKMMGSSATLPASSPASSKLTRHSSSLTLVDQTRLKKTDGDRQSLRGARSRTGSFRNSSLLGHASSEADLAGLVETSKASSSGSLPTLTETPSPPESSSQPSDADIIGFVDRFRSMVNQVTRDVDNGSDIMRTDGMSEDYPPSSSYTDPLESQSGSPDPIYDEFGLVQGPDDRVLVLGGYIRRMPTIESLGSRETGSFYHSSSYRDTMIMSSSSRSGSGNAHVQLSTRSNTSESIPAETRSRNSSFYASSDATGGHCVGGGTGVSNHSASNGDIPFVEDTLTLADSPIDFDPSKHDQDDIIYI